MAQGYNPACNNLTGRPRLCLRYPRLSVLTCKAVTQEISTYPGFSTATELIHSDDEDGFLEADLYQGFPRQSSFVAVRVTPRTTGWESGRCFGVIWQLCGRRWAGTVWEI